MDGEAIEALDLGNATDQALIEIGQWLRDEGYRFVTPTPETHARVLERAGKGTGNTIRDIFGWSRPFSNVQLPHFLLDCLAAAKVLERRGDAWVSKVRFSTLDDFLFVHSAYPTLDQDAVFFGPDTYRFAAFIKHQCRRPGRPKGGVLVDVGCGSGAGGLVARRELGSGLPLILADISPKALHYAWVNCQLAGQNDVEFRLSDVLDAVSEPVGVVVTNPPYLVDATARKYRDGGGDLGSALSTRICTESLARLATGGKLLLYTGVPIVDGKDAFRESVEPALALAGGEYTYEELDPDVFGEELERDVYAAAERIAVVGLSAVKRAARAD